MQVYPWIYLNMHLWSIYTAMAPIRKKGCECLSETVSKNHVICCDVCLWVTSFLFYAVCAFISALNASRVSPGIGLASHLEKKENFIGEFKQHVQLPSLCSIVRSAASVCSVYQQTSKTTAPVDRIITARITAMSFATPSMFPSAVSSGYSNCKFTCTCSLIPNEIKIKSAF